MHFRHQFSLNIWTPSFKKAFISTQLFQSILKNTNSWCYRGYGRGRIGEDTEEGIGNADEAISDAVDDITDFGGF